MNAKQIWQTTLERLHTKITVAVFTTWFQGTSALSFQDGVLVVSVSTTFSKAHLEARYTDLIRSILTEITGSVVDVRFVVAHELPENDEEVANLLPPPAPLPAPKRGYRLSKGRLGALRPDMNSADAQEASFANSAPPALTRQVAHRSGALSANSEEDAGRVNERQSIQPGLFFAGEGVLNPRYMFSSFITGKSNQLAHAASLAVAENPGHVYNPLFLYGGVGLGKTHLMHAIGHIGEAAGLNVLYVTSEKFTNEIINAIRFQKTAEFRAKYRQIDILLVDDIQFIAGKESTEEEFFHTFNSLHSANKQIIVSSDRPPKAIPSLQDRLRSRFEWGLLADIQPPEYEHRMAILRSKAESLRFALPAAVIEYVARPACSSVRELEGALNRVIAYATLHDAALSVELAVQALENVYGNAHSIARPAISRTMLTARVVLDGVCRYYNIELERMQSKQRDREIVWPRQVAMYLMREETDASLLQIGSALGGRDHTTIIHGCEKVRIEMERDEHLRREVAEALESLRSSL
ncbi:MAG TPA: chromosomal replication initiator protein DnaA [Ktedonobacteraceae bacterium]